MSEVKSQNAIKVVLSSGRTVLLREMKIKYQTLAATAVGKRAGDNQLALATMMNQELLRLLLISINDAPVSGNDREDLDNLFSYSEYQQLSKVLNQVMGGEDAGEVQTEIVVTGKQ